MKVYFYPTLALGLLAATLPVALPAWAHDDHEHYVSPSAQTPIAPGDRIANLYPEQLAKPYLLQKLTPHMYWASVHGYNALFYVGKEGVLVVDPLSDGAGKGLLQAIRSVTNLPITGLVYTHFHLDHIGDAKVIVDSGKNIKIYGSKTTAENVKRFGQVPEVTNIVAEPTGQFVFENTVVQMITPPHGHSDDNSMIYFPSEKVVQYVDMINPDQMPYLNFAGVQDLNAYKDNLNQLLTLDWTLMNAGHGNVGTKDDVRFVLTYISELETAIRSTFGTIKPITYHDASYNHQRASERYKAAVTAAIRPQFEKKYGTMYGFNEAFPVQVGVVLTNLQLYGEPKS
jgi:glyoxylase-like metal-dependent hydrolase (beta-lactamase superfamily II)